MKLILKLIMCMLFLVYMTGCSNDQSSHKKKEKSGTGSISLSIDAMGKRTARGINLNSIAYLNVKIMGQGFTTVIDSELPKGDVAAKVYTLDVINNIIVEVEFLDSNRNPIMGNAKIYGYGNVVEDSITTIEVSWQLTPVARVLEQLLTNGYDIHNYDATALQAAVDTEMGTNNINPVAVNISAIAAGVQGNAAYATVDMYPTVTINGSVGVAEAGIIVMINDPHVAKTETDASGNFILTGIAPGTWSVTLSDGGSRQVVVATDGTYTPNPFALAEGLYSPVIYKWGVASLTENDVRKALLTSHVGDMDGLADINSVSIMFADRSTVHALADDGTGFYLDTDSADGKFEAVIDHELVDGLYSIDVADSSVTETGEQNFTFTYIDSAVVTSISAGQNLTDRTPLIEWNAVANASSYRAVIESAGIEVYNSGSISSTSHYVPSANSLADGSYTLYVYAYNGFTGYRGALSIRSIDFTVQVSGGLKVSLPDVRELYLQDGNKIVSYDKIANTKTDILDSTGSVKLCDVSPDGQNILFIENGSLYRMRGNGTGKFLLASPYQVSIRTAKWSPDGSKIAFSIYNNSVYSLYIINLDGSGELLLDSINGFEAYTFSKDSAKIFYFKSSLLASINTDGSGYVTLRNSTNGKFLKLSPNGDSLLFGNGDVYTINTDGTKYFTVFNASDVSNACWLRDGRIVFLDDYSSVYDYEEGYVINNNGAGRRLIDYSARNASALICSPWNNKIYISVYNVLEEISITKSSFSTKTLTYPDSTVFSNVVVSPFTW